MNKHFQSAWMRNKEQGTNNKKKKFSCLFDCNPDATFKKSFFYPRLFNESYEKMVTILFVEMQNNKIVRLLQILYKDCSLINVVI